MRTGTMLSTLVPLLVLACSTFGAQQPAISPVGDGTDGDRSDSDLARVLFHPDDLPGDYSSPADGGTNWTGLFPSLDKASSSVTQTFGVTSNYVGEVPGAAGIFVMPSPIEARNAFRDILAEYRNGRQDIWDAASFTLIRSQDQGRETFIWSREDHGFLDGDITRYSQIVFLRCSAIGLVHVGWNGVLEDAVSYAERLDARIQPTACQYP